MKLKILHLRRKRKLVKPVKPPSKSSPKELLELITKKILSITNICHLAFRMQFQIQRASFPVDSLNTYLNLKLFSLWLCGYIKTIWAWNWNASCKIISNGYFCYRLYIFSYIYFKIIHIIANICGNFIIVSGYLLVATFLLAKSKSVQIKRACH